jgi:hypothetical protein
MNVRGLSLLILLFIPVAVYALQEGEAVRMGDTGRLVYEEDAMGNRVPDFSSAGYAGGGVSLPVAPVHVVIAPGENDRARIQAALDFVANMEPDAEGIRGAVQLTSGTFNLDGSLDITASGVILRGAGDGVDGTVLKVAYEGREALIRVCGVNSERMGPEVPITANHVPVGALKIPLENADSFAEGERIRIRRPSPVEWIEAVGMHVAPARTHYAWKAGKLDIVWERRVVAVEADHILLDAPLTTALEKRFGSGVVYAYRNDGRVSNVGVEQLRLLCPLNSQNPLSEEHAWIGIQVDYVEDSWIRNVTGEGLASALVYLGSETRAITVMDTTSTAPQSEIGGYRRFAFFSAGGQNLFVRCVAKDALHAFAAGYLTPGPVVFFECNATQVGGFSGSTGSWASGLLFDNVHISGGALALDNLEVGYAGVGWAAANSVLWQSSASRIICRSPQGALNWAIGTWGQFWGDGRWQSSNEFVDPDSLYRAQLAERMGDAALDALEPVHAAPQSDASLAWEALGIEIPEAPVEALRALRLDGGWLVTDSGIMAGSIRPVSWWRGHLLPARSGEHADALTRWLPGRVGTGQTNDLEVIAKRMEAAGQIQIRHHWGLWYDRRREDHQMISRMSPNVWPPFYEQPWARSGEGKAWDGLSKYDLTHFNPWYFSRLKGFAEAAAQYGRVLVNEMYFQHNILESGAHWVDFPWRPVNCLQDTGFTEPPPFTGDTIRMAHEFYDLTHPVRRELHRAYIRQCLDNLEGQPNVIHTLGDEYSGPLEFMQFWLDVVDEWVQEKPGRHPIIALSAPRDVQDAILEDSRRSQLIDVIEFKYWWYAGNETYEPLGGTRLAPRQHLRRWKGGRATAADLARMVREYREQFPDKAVIYSELHVQHPWAALAAGASFVPLPATADPAILSPGGEYQLSPQIASGQWGIQVENSSKLIYCAGQVPLAVDLEAWSGTYRLVQIDMQTGLPAEDFVVLAGGQLHQIERFSVKPAVYWITRNPN